MKKSDLVKMGNHYFLGEDVAKTLLPRIKEIKVEDIEDLEV